MPTSSSISILAFALLFPLSLSAQVTTTAVPFLLINYSSESDGMGQTSFGRVSSDPMLMMRNAGLAGFGALCSEVAYAQHTEFVHWLPAFQIPDLGYRTNAVRGGVEIGTTLGLPFKLGIGGGYDYSRLDLGTFALTNNDPTIIATHDAWEDFSSWYLGIGIDFGIRIGIGGGSTFVRSSLAPFGTGINSTDTAKVSLGRYGIVAEFPLGELLFPRGNSPRLSLVPLASISMGYAVNNIGVEMRYAGQTQADPLPRQVGIGYTLSAGLAARQGEREIAFLRGTYAHDAEGLLVSYRDSSRWTYTDGLGPIDLVDHGILGRSSRSVIQRTGLEVSVLEIFTYREGRFDGPGYPIIRTSGNSWQLEGVFRLLDMVLQNDITLFLASHFNVQVHESKYHTYDPAHPLDRIFTRSIVFIVH